MTARRTIVLSRFRPCLGGCLGCCVAVTVEAAVIVARNDNWDRTWFLLRCTRDCQRSKTHRLVVFHVEIQTANGMGVLSGLLMTHFSGCASVLGQQQKLWSRFDMTTSHMQEHKRTRRAAMPPPSFHPFDTLSMTKVSLLRFIFSLFACVCSSEAFSPTLTMTGYLLSFAKITDNEAMSSYVAKVGDTLEPFGGELCAKGPLKGAEYCESEGYDFDNGILLRFPSLQKGLDWYKSDDYRAIRPVRLGASHGPLAIFEGDDCGDAEGFLLSSFAVTKPEVLAQYNPGPILEKYGGKMLGMYTDEEGSCPDASAAEDLKELPCGVVVAFPTKAKGVEFITSDDYKEMKKLRLASTTGPLVVLDKIH